MLNKLKIFAVQDLQVTHNMAVIQPSLKWSKQNLYTITIFCLKLFVKKVIFVTEFVVWGKNLSFYEVSKNNFPNGVISKKYS